MDTIKYFNNLNYETKKEILKKVFQLNNNYMFDIESNKSIIGLDYALRHDIGVQKTFEHVIKKYNY